MNVAISERCFEEAIECSLLESGPDACVLDVDAIRAPASPVYRETQPGGYRKRRPEDYDRTLCLIPRDVVDFILATQPKEWQKLRQHHGSNVQEQFLARLAGEIERRGALDILRNGIKDSGCKFKLAYFPAASGLNEETRRLHAANVFAIVRQVHYSTKNENCLDLVLFLNGIPIFTAELKNPLNGQNVEDAIHQYKTNRDPREPLLAYRRCLAHFAVDTELVYVATRLDGAKTRFLPFQPRQIRWRRQPAGSAHAFRLRNGVSLGRDLGPGQRSRSSADPANRGRQDCARAPPRHSRPGQRAQRL